MRKLAFSTLEGLYDARGRKRKRLKFKDDFRYQLKLTTVPFTLVIEGRYNEGFTSLGIFTLSCCKTSLVSYDRCKDCLSLPKYKAYVNILEKTPMDLCTFGVWRKDEAVLHELELAYGEKDTLEGIVWAQDVLKALKAILGPEPKIGTARRRRLA